MKEVTKHYSNGEVTIVWKSSLCRHSTNCIHGLPEVFKADQTPWIIPESSTTEKIVEQVKKCPSGALTFFYRSEK